jgi:Zn-dependent peptidase ImmA (M78 family)/DNA-binding XRE family transcriptional regulator
MVTKKYAYINKDMLLWARSETPFTTPFDVEMYISGISAEKLATWENGTDLPSITEAKKLATAYRVPFASFYLPAPPEKKVKKYTDRRTVNGAVYSDISYALWSEINRIIANRDKLLEYVDDVENTEIPPIPVLGDNASVEEIASTLRNFLGLHPPFRTKSSYKNNAFNYFRSILEHHGIIVAQVSGVALTEMKGLSIYYEPCSIIAVNNKDFERAKVFSLFHELAHLIRRSSSLCLIDFDERNDDEEKICDRIAAEALMPESSFRAIANETWPLYKEWSSYCLQSIGDRFGVSSVSILLRLHELKIINKSEYQRIYAILSDEFEAKREEIEQSRKGKNIPMHYYVKYLNQQGYLFPRVVLNAHARGDISYGEMCRTLNVSSKHIGNIERAVMFI